MAKKKPELTVEDVEVSYLKKMIGSLNDGDLADEIVTKKRDDEEIFEDFLSTMADLSEEDSDKLPEGVVVFYNAIVNGDLSEMKSILKSTGKSKSDDDDDDDDEPKSKKKKKDEDDDDDDDEPKSKKKSKSDDDDDDDEPKSKKKKKSDDDDDDDDEPKSKKKKKSDDDDDDDDDEPKSKKKKKSDDDDDDDDDEPKSKKKKKDEDDDDDDEPKSKKKSKSDDDDDDDKPKSKKKKHKEEEEESSDANMFGFKEGSMKAVISEMFLDDGCSLEKAAAKVEKKFDREGIKTYGAVLGVIKKLVKDGHKVTVQINAKPKKG